jgi:hypothetical protein
LPSPMASMVDPREVAKIRLLNSISSPVLTSLLWGRGGAATRVNAHCAQG